jgi:hypothetical protein
MKRLIVLATLMCLGCHPARAGDHLLYGDLTDAQINTVKMTSIARYAGTHNVCPRYHIIENAVFAEWVDAKIPKEMVGTTYFENVQTVAWLGAIERQRENPSDFCLAAWQLFGPNGVYRRQLLEAN